MTAAWAPEIVVDQAGARRLIESQFELRPRILELLGEGWDMTVWLADGQHVFRFPRREVVVPGLLRELEVLPHLAPLLPLPIPAPALVGRPDSGFPWPFYGAQLLAGSEVGQALLPQPQLDELAPALGGFLRALHGCPAPELPADPQGRADMAVRVPRARESLARLAELGLWRAPAVVAELLEEAERLPPAAELVLAHGDLHLRHLLVDGGRPSGVIDWIDVCRAPRAVDLVLYWALFSESGRRDFAHAYGDLDPASLLRARVLSFNLCAILADYAHSTGTGWLEQAAVAGLDRTAG